jgi:pimeloyl-ACP methyl ester carboxylesterase
MGSPAPILYLHGFASSPASKKATFFQDKFGPRLCVPDLVGEDFYGMTLTAQLEVIGRKAGEGPVDLMGSSMGGYLAALFAAANPGKVRKVVLLAPAFDFANRWAGALGEAAVADWRATGSMAVFHYGWRRQARVGWQLFEDSLLHQPFPAVTQPVLIFHGVDDAVVPVSLSVEFARRTPGAILHQLPSDHELIDVLDFLWAEAGPFLA